MDGVKDSPIIAFHSPWFFGELLEAVKNAPTYHVILEVLLVALVLRLWFYSSYKIEREELTEEEQEQLIREWKPEPLVPLNEDLQNSFSVQSSFGDSVSETDANWTDVNANVICGPVGKHVDINGKNCLDLATFDFLGIIGCKRIEEASVTALKKYGVGSCGPRGFYGSIDAHISLEKERELAHFMGVEEAILYSYGFATVASAIAAYAKKGDILYVDEAINFSVQQGIRASRSKVKWFKHNDMGDLERLLKEQAAEDKRDPKKAKVTRSFMIVEGLYLNQGTICPLPKLIDLKYAYKVRLFIDETYSFATLGATGKGVTEHFNCDVTDVDWICGSLENSVGSGGGFCCGSSYVIDHQRLSGSGYCFSASAPPLLSVAAIEALNIIKEEPDRLQKLQENSRVLNAALMAIDKITCPSEANSPIQHVVLQDPSLSYEDCKSFLIRLRDKMIDQGYLTTVAAHLNQFEVFRQRPSVRLCVKSTCEENEIESFANLFKLTLNQFMQS
ncbi:serine palmitoyltransferase 1-like [Symsagittifera roscoffensis]|uniref:serine palmitoyltransferase 1-like n=1 Tax=Symsagittifera roscoffensis TaxID=84072 RepID=UPI00307CAA47